MALSNRHKKMVSWLTIVLLLGNSAISPICQHAHAEGDTPHKTHSHHHLSHDDSHGHHHSHAHDSSQLMSGLNDSHVHVAVLGFQITLSIPEQDQSDESQHVFDNQISLVMWDSDFLPRAESDAKALEYEPTNPSSYVSPDESFAPKINRDSGTLPHVLLCDTARHKRSGVQCF